MKVVEIFRSIEGEGKRVGLPTTFIRLYGCPLTCSFCDTRYACEGDGYAVMSIPQIMEQVEYFKVKSVTVTGGEPMIHPGIKSLLKALVEGGYHVNVETNGTMFPYHYIYDPTEVKYDLDKKEVVPTYTTYGDIFYTMDWKCKSSGMEDKMDIDLVNELTENDVLKFVVGSVEDMDGSLEVIEKMTSHPAIYFSPVFDKIEPKEIVDYLMDKQLFECKVQVQLHKVIYPVNMRGV